MQTKIIQFIPVLLALATVGFRHFSVWCISPENFCYRTTIDQTFLYTVNPIYFFAVAFLPIAVILIFVSRQIFQSWSRLAMWFVPLSLFVILVTPVTSNSWMPLFFISREEISWYLGILFSIISLILVIYKYFSLRRSPLGPS